MRVGSDADSPEFRVWEGDAGPPSHSIPPHQVAKAAARLGVKHSRAEDLPSNREIRDQVQVFARIHEGEQRFDNLKEMRVAALRIMHLLERFTPRLIGSVMTGHIRCGECETCC